MEAPLKLLCLAALLALHAGCSISHRVTCSTYADPACPRDFQGKDLYVEEASDEDNPILARCIRAKIESMLQAAGATVVALDEVGYALEYRYGMGPEVPVTATRRRHEWGETITIETYDEDGKKIEKRIHLPDQVHYERYTRILRKVWVRLQVTPGRALEDEEAPSPLWIGKAHVRIESGGVESVIDYLLVPLVDRLGRNTFGEKTITVSAEDPRIAERSEAASPGSLR